MAKLGINTGASPNDNSGDSLIVGAIKINSNFDEIYTYLGAGSTTILSAPIWSKSNAGISTLQNVGIGTTNPTSTLTVSGNAIFTGVVTATSFVGDGSGLTGIGGISSSVVTTTTLNSTIGNIVTGVVTTISGTNLIYTGIGTIGTLGVSGVTTTQHLNVTGISTLGIVTSGNIFSTGVVTATSFVGDGSGLTGIVDISSGIVVLDDNSNIGTAATINFGDNLTVSTISAGVVTVTAIPSQWISTVAGIHTSSNVGIGTTNPTSKLSVVGDGNFTGILTASSFSGNASSATYATSAGISTYTSEWFLGANGNSDYTFTGPGLSGAENDPTLYLIRGQQYKFTNQMGQHPFRIQTTPNGSVGTQYNDGIDNNDVSNGTLTWNVQFDSPNTLYYQCTAHPDMGGVINILNVGGGESYWASTVAGIHTSSNVGIGTTNPTSALTVTGDGNFTGVVTATTFVGQINAGISTISVNSSSNALRITQTGSGNALVVEDETNPDTSPFIVTATGRVGMGTTSPVSYLDIYGGSYGEAYIRGDNGSELYFQVSRGDTNSHYSYIGQTYNGVTTLFAQPNGSSNSNYIFQYDYPTKTSRFQAGQVDVIKLFGDGGGTYGRTCVIGDSNSLTRNTTTNQVLQVQGGTYISGNVGIGTTNPTEKLTVSGGDISVGVSTAHGVILTSPNGTQYRLIVDNSGSLSTVAV